MNIANIDSGTYVLAVSGGVDSVVLLDILAKDSNLNLIVAHFDHGTRDDSHEDAKFVKNLAKKYGLKFEVGREDLGHNASEDVARKARYSFLKQVKEKYSAKGIITAHHQDDLLETALINLIRGSRWRGLASLRQTTTIIRPFLGVTKQEVKDYANHHQHIWREDPTNVDDKFLRNFVRLKIVPKLNQLDKADFLRYIAEQNKIRPEIESVLQDLIKSNARITKNSIEFHRNWLTMLPTKVAKEILNEVHFMLSGKRAQKQTLARMLWFCKTAKLYKTLQVSKTLEVQVKPRAICIKLAD